ncbi:glycosyltransferase family 4 protein [Bacillus wiedmannii]|uniref:glycosyltransferase family 4 protein n=1 Tax=Bacillus wiedmannii TaxID=1890302 RepID=UPI000BEFBAFD|nr:glycosyltransferase family 4 protein [Bacillus wiedmannii]PEO38856.1 hypothetical protein CN555_11340 [Bacillus wiedmannii]
MGYRNTDKQKVKKQTMKVNKNKVCMYSSVHVWKDARIFFKEAHSLQKQYEVDFIAIDDGTYDQSFDKKNINMQLLPRKSRWLRPLTWIRIYQKIRASDAYVYHFHDPELLVLVPWIKRKNKQIILVYDMHENVPAAILSKQWIPKSMRRHVSNLVRQMETILLKQVDAILFAETSYKKDYLYTEGKQTEDILNYPIQQDAAPVKKKTTEEITLIYVGRIAEVRGIWTMLQVAKELKNQTNKKLTLKLIGAMSPDLETEVNRFIEKNALGDVVIYYGMLPYTEIWNHYATADIGLCLLHPEPNYMNSLATKMFEYMSMGLPMIASNFPDWEKLIIENQCGIVVDPFNVQSIVEEILHVMQNEKLRRTLGDNGKLNFETKYTWSIEEVKLLEFYENLK